MHVERLMPVMQPVPKDVLGDFSVRLNRGFILGGELFDTINLLTRPHESGITARYLAISNNGRKVCLTIFPSEEMAYKHHKHGSINIPAQIAYAREGFMAEPVVLRRLEQAETSTGTHYFPLLLSEVYDAGGLNPAYVIEFLEGGDIRTASKSQLEEYKIKYETAIHIAHGAGIHFADLRVEDLRVLPDGQAMIIDFNNTDYGNHISEEQARQNDFERLQRIFIELITHNTPHT